MPAEGNAARVELCGPVANGTASSSARGPTCKAATTRGGPLVESERAQAAGLILLLYHRLGDAEGRAQAQRCIGLNKGWVINDNKG